MSIPKMRILSQEIQYLEKLNGKLIFIILYAFMLLWAEVTNSLPRALLFLISIDSEDYFNFQVEGINQTEELIWAIFLAPILETLFYQGLILQVIFKKIVIEYRIILTSCLFFIDHYFTNGMGNALNAFGLCMAFSVCWYIFHKRYGVVKAILATLFLHSLWNTLCL